MSLIGAISETIEAFAWPISHRTAALASRSVSIARSGIGATLARAIRIRSILPPFIFARPASATFEMACARRVPTLRKYCTQPSVVRGNRMRAMISSAAMTLVLYPV